MRRKTKQSNVSTESVLPKPKRSLPKRSSSTRKAITPPSSAPLAGAKEISARLSLKFGKTDTASISTSSRSGAQRGKNKNSTLRGSKITADEIADLASQGHDVSQYFTNQFIVIRPIQRVNVDFTEGMLTELDARAAQLNISRQAVIKTLLRQALDASVRR